LCGDNRNGATALLIRISEIAHELQNYYLTDEGVDSHVLQFVRSAVFATIRTGLTEHREIRLLHAITKRLEPLRTRSWPASYIRAQRDASLIQGCTNELNTRNSDIQVRVCHTLS